MTAVHRKYNRPGREVSVSAIRRHAMHVLSSDKVGKGSLSRLPGAEVSGVSGRSLLERVEELIKKHEGLATTATGTGQIIPAVAALRELRANLELLGKLSGELANANINFYSIEFTEDRIRQFLEAAKLRAPQLGDFVRDQALEQFGHTLPQIHINFAHRPGLAPGKHIITGKDPARDQDGNLLLEAGNQPSNSQLQVSSPPRA